MAFLDKKCPIIIPFGENHWAASSNITAQIYVLISLTSLPEMKILLNLDEYVRSIEHKMAFVKAGTIDKL
jgi:hypothetical protein